MKPIALLLVGAAFGSLASHYLTRAYIVLDAGLSYTYRCDQLSRDANARDTAQALLEQLLNAQGASDLPALAERAGLHVTAFHKGDVEVTQVNVTHLGSGLEFTRSAAGHITMDDLPGSPRCAHDQARLTSTDPTE